ncbi:MAG TPA: hypothetical protein GX400_21740 [Chloroflexi bacterium]|nr:hypothetical protein [Chloroflexota bacterium]
MQANHLIVILTSVSLVTLLLVMPGLALIKLTGVWSDWLPLQSVILALGIGLSFYPVIFYFLRLVAPGFHIQGWMGWTLLLLSSGIAATKVRHWRIPFRRIDVMLIATIAVLTFISRIWLVYEQPFPAWTDSLHHTLLTKLTAEQGQLPYNLQPYLDIPLDMYHLGLYALSGMVVQMLGIPAHTALIWTIQSLNALSIAGVFLILDRYVGRTGAITGMLVVGLLSHQPAFYANWGRDTQLAAQTLMLIAWIMVFDTIEQSRLTDLATQRRQSIAQAIFAGVASAAVFLYHFRGSIFYIAFLLPGILYLWWSARRIHNLPSTIFSTMLIGAVALMIILPAVLPAVKTWVELNRAAIATPVVDVAETQQNQSGFFAFDLSHFSSLAARPWLLTITTLSALYGLKQKERIVWLSAVWFILLMVIGNLYLLKIPVLSVTNMGAILIMLYMPISLMIGAAIQHITVTIPRRWRRQFSKGSALVTVLLAIIFMWVRAHDYEAFRFFVTDADVKAAEWLADNAAADDRVVINTTFWLPTTPHGTDAGYWIPYLSHHQTNTGVMISSLGGVSLLKDIIADSKLAKRAEHDSEALSMLYQRGYRFIYIGARGSYEGGGFDAETLQSTGQADIAYDEDGVKILKIRSP